MRIVFRLTHKTWTL